MTKRHALLKALAALLTACALLCAVSAQASRNLPRCAEKVTMPTQAVPQDAATKRELAQISILMASEGNFTTEKEKRATGAYRGLCEGDAITGDLTFYCSCSKCCGKWADVSPRTTADGTPLDDLADGSERVVSCNWLPFDAVIEADGTQYRVADRGGKGLSRVGRLDVYVPEGHQAALDAGRRRGVTIKVVSLP